MGQPRAGRAALSPLAPLPLQSWRRGYAPVDDHPVGGVARAVVTPFRRPTRFSSSAPPHRAGFPRLKPRDAVGFGLDDLAPLCKPYGKQRLPEIRKNSMSSNHMFSVELMQKIELP